MAIPRSVRRYVVTDCEPELQITRSFRGPDDVYPGYAYAPCGCLFACEHLELEPDIMTVGKALTGGVSGIGVVLMTDDVAVSLREHGNVYSTTSPSSASAE